MAGAWAGVVGGEDGGSGGSAWMGDRMGRMAMLRIWLWAGWQPLVGVRQGLCCVQQMVDMGPMGSRARHCVGAVIPLILLIPLIPSSTQGSLGGSCRWSQVLGHPDGSDGMLPHEWQAGQLQ
jgi:hypothetical protein